IDNVSLTEDFTTPPALTVNISPSSATINCGSSVTLTPTVSNALCTTTYNWQPGNQTTASVSVSPSSNTTYTLTVSDGCRSANASANITVVTNSLSVTAIAQINANCTGATNGVAT